MTAEEREVVRLRNDFYRDGFYKVLLALLMMLASIALLVAVSFSLYLEKPAPVTFITQANWRVFPLTPVNEPYVTSANLLQWVSNVVPQSFSFDFVNYNNEMNALTQYYTNDGFKKLTDLINIYANATTVQNSRLFIKSEPSSVASIFNQGLINQGALQGVYGWWIQIPLNLHYSSPGRIYDTPLSLQVLVIRIPTVNTLTGIAIEDIIVSKAAQGGQTRNNV